MSLICSIAPARVADAATIALLSRNLVEYGLPWRWTPERISRALTDPDYVVLSARQGPGLAGFGVMQYLSSKAHLCLLGVVPDARRRGVATEILNWLEKSAVVAGIFSVALEVRKADPGALNFYRQHGFVEEKTLRNYYCRGQHAVRMSHNLSVQVS